MDWTAQDAAALAGFLGQPSGQKFMATLRSMRPKLKPSDKIEEAAMTAQYVAGGESMLEAISTLSTFEAQSGKSPFLAVTGKR